MWKFHKHSQYYAQKEKIIKSKCHHCPQISHHLLLHAYHFQVFHMFHSHLQDLCSLPAGLKVWFHLFWKLYSNDEWIIRPTYISYLAVRIIYILTELAIVKAVQLFVAILVSFFFYIFTTFDILLLAPCLAVVHPSYLALPFNKNQFSYTHRLLQSTYGWVKLSHDASQHYNFKEQNANTSQTRTTISRESCIKK